MRNRLGDGWSDITLKLDNEDAEMLLWFLTLSEYPSNGPDFAATQGMKTRIAPRLSALLER